MDSPKIISLESVYISSEYDFKVKVDTESVPLDKVQIRINNLTVPLTYNLVHDFWQTQIMLPCGNYSYIVDFWYPWDILPVASILGSVTYYGPSYTIDSFIPHRNGFSCDLFIEKTNASLSLDSPIMEISNYSIEIQLVGSLIENPLSGTYQLWRFLSPILDPGMYNISITGHDIYNIQSNFRMFFNSTDSFPQIEDIRLILTENTSSGSLFSVRVIAYDDYSVSEVLLLINQIRYPLYQINVTYFGTEFFLTEGYYNIYLLVLDDINQEVLTFLKFIEVDIDNLNSNSSLSRSNFSNTSLGTQSTTNSMLNPQIEEGDVIELGFVSGIFTGLAALGNSYLRKRRTAKQ